MILAPLLSALALTANAPTPWACDLNPSIGQGQSDEGRIETLTTLGFACRYELFQLYGVAFSPVLGLDKQMWSVRTSDGAGKNLSSYETQDFNVGLRLGYELSEKFSLFYGFTGGQGKGSLETTASTETSSINGSFGDLRQNSLSHTLGLAYRLTERLDISFAWQAQTASQSWGAEPGDLFVQSVASDMAMTLTDGNATHLVGSPLRTRNTTRTNALQIGLSLRFGG